MFPRAGREEEDRDEQTIYLWRDAGRFQRGRAMSEEGHKGSSSGLESRKKTLGTPQEQRRFTRTPGVLIKLQHAKSGDDGDGDKLSFACRLDVS